ncbi:hypothetical protein HMPREF9120_00388 [Neisseria sp. oral taxon 020 str. F0370]|nr:hypothetical protein HMPREF9120_00388 [Neisseria sp. oral taxon 020 str. F0370]
MWKICLSVGLADDVNLAAAVGAVDGIGGIHHFFAVFAAALCAFCAFCAVYRFGVVAQLFGGESADVGLAADAGAQRQGSGENQGCLF